MSKKGWPLYMDAIGLQNLELLKLIIPKNANLNDKFDDVLPIYRAVMHGSNNEIIKLLISKGADVKKEDTNLSCMH